MVELIGDGEFREKYAERLRDWVANGAESRYALSPDEVIARSQPSSPASLTGRRAFRAGPAHLAARRVSASWRSRTSTPPTSCSRTTSPTSGRPTRSWRRALRRRGLGTLPAGARGRRGLAVRLRLQPGPDRVRTGAGQEARPDLTTVGRWRPPPTTGSGSVTFTAGSPIRAGRTRSLERSARSYGRECRCRHRLVRAVGS